MEHLPADFAETLTAVLEPGHEGAAAEVIEAAVALDDQGLRVFLELFAARVRASAKPITRSELEEFLRASGASGRAGAP